MNPLKTLILGVFFNVALAYGASFAITPYGCAEHGEFSFIYYHPLSYYDGEFWIFFWESRASTQRYGKADIEMKIFSNGQELRVAGYKWPDGVIIKNDYILLSPSLGLKSLEKLIAGLGPYLRECASKHREYED